MTSALQHHLAHLCTDRALAVATRDEADTRVKALNKQLLVALQDAQSLREQLLDGTIVSIVQPKDRETILPEKLLTLGVDPDVIRAATRLTPVAGFIRVDAPKSGAEDVAATSRPTTPEGVGDAPESRPH